MAKNKRNYYGSRKKMKRLPYKSALRFGKKCTDKKFKQIIIVYTVGDMFINTQNPKIEPPSIKTRVFRVKNSFDL